MTERRRPRIVEREAPLPPTPTAVAEPRKPRALEIEGIVLEDDAFAAPAAVEAATPTVAKRRGPSWLAIAVSALLGLAGLAVGLWIEGLVGRLFALNPYAGIAALVLVAILLIALGVALVREIVALWRLRTWNDVREKAVEAVRLGDERSVKAVERDLLQLFGKRTDLAAGRRALADSRDDVMDPADRLAFIDRSLLRPIDQRARALVLGSAKRVSIVTAVAPRALIDIAFVILESVRLIRSIAELYGMRPGKIGLLRLCRDVIGHLAVTGAIAVGDSIAGEAFGHGVASRVSRRFGEGVLNGLMTARIGISAMDLCRPLPFAAGARPRIADLARESATGTRERSERSNADV